MKFIDDLHNAIADWQSGINDEWYLSNFIEKSVDNLNSIEAFQAINDIVPILLDNQNKALWSDLFEVLFALVKQSNTTEMPSLLKREWKNIQIISEANGNYALNRMTALKKYYRI